jgi:hypothetical protein
MSRFQTPKGGKHVAAIWEADPDAALLIDEVCQRVYPGINRVEKKHRVAVMRAAQALVKTLPTFACDIEALPRSLYPEHYRKRPPAKKVFFNPGSAYSVALALLKLQTQGRITDADLRAKLAPGGDWYERITGDGDIRIEVSLGGSLIEFTAASFKTRRRGVVITGANRTERWSSFEEFEQAMMPVIQRKLRALALADRKLPRERKKRLAVIDEATAPYRARLADQAAFIQLVKELWGVSVSFTYRGGPEFDLPHSLGKLSPYDEQMRREYVARAAAQVEARKTHNNGLCPVHNVPMDETHWNCRFRCKVCGASYAPGDTSHENCKIGDPLEVLPEELTIRHTETNRQLGFGSYQKRKIKVRY